MLTSPLYAIVVDEELRASSRGKDFWQVVLKTCNGTFKGMMWDALPNAAINDNYPHKGEFIKVDNFVDQLSDKGSVVLKFPIEKISKEEYAKEYSEIMNSGGFASQEEIQEALDVIFDKTLFDESIYNFVIACFKAQGLQKLKVAPAATNNHHAYPGGLLIHVKEVLQTCKEIYKVYNKKYNYINKDVLFCAAILHDIGKVKTYAINEQGLAESIYIEKTLGHIALGMSMVEHTFLSLPLEEQEKIGHRFLYEVLHCIATHHGRIEYGNVKEIQSIEAQILSSSDLVSSRVGMLDKTLKEIPKHIKLKPGDQIRLHSDTSFTNSIAIEESRS